MKLKNLAALFFRMIGVLFLIGGVSLIPAIIVGFAVAIVLNTVTSFIIGYCLIRYSKKLALLLCKSLEDDWA